MVADAPSLVPPFAIFNTRIKETAVKVIVMINGEKQCGKSTFAEHLALMLDREAQIVASIHSLVSPLRTALEALWSSTHSDDPLVPDYEALKLETIGGATGRDWMIELGNAARRLGLDTLIRLFAESAIALPDVEVFIIENWGFPDELYNLGNYLPCSVLGDVEIITVALTARATRTYASGERFDDDNRFNMPHLASYVNPRVNDLARAVTGHLVDAVDPSLFQTDTIAVQFGYPTRSVPLNEAIQSLDYGDDGQWESDVLPSVEHLKMITGDSSLTISEVSSAMNGRRRSDFAPPAVIDVETRVGDFADPETAIEAVSQAD